MTTVQRIREELVVAALFLLLAIAMTWPLARNLGSVVADPTDPYINTWILDWDYYATFVSPRSLFDANIFAPANDTLAFSENLFGLAILAAPLRWAGLRPLTVHNVLFLFGFWACGYAACLLGRHVAKSTGAGIVAGVFYAFVPWRFTHITHVQYAWTAVLPLLVLSIIAYAERPSIKRAAFVGAATLATGVANLHAFAFGGVAAVFVAVILIQRQRSLAAPRALLPPAIAAAIACLILLPLLLPYRTAAREYHMRGDTAEVLHYSAEPSDWLLANFQNRVYRSMMPVDPSIDAERWLFPGFGCLILTIVAVIAAWRARELSTPLTIGLALIALGFVGSLGLRTPFHAILFDTISMFRGIRVPARWAMIAHVGLAITAALGCATLMRRRWIAFAIAIALLLELRAAPIAYKPAATDVPQVYRWLAAAHPRGILELPIGVGNSEYLYMLYATAHHARMINGVSGFTPPQFERVAREFRGETPSSSLVPYLRSAAIDTIIVHENALTDGTNAVQTFIRSETLQGRIRLERTFGSDVVYAITP